MASSGTCLDRRPEGLQGSHREPQGATGGYREPGGTTGDHRALEAIRGHVSKNNMGSKMVSASRIRDLRRIRLAEIVFDFFYMCLFGRKVGLE